jgi:hypothetical protein
MWNLETISPSLSDPSSNYPVPYYNDDDNSINLMQNGESSINVNIDISLATSCMNGSPSVLTTPITPGLVSPSHPGYAPSPSLLTVTPPTPSHMPRPAYTSFPSSASIFPYPSQSSPWHIPIAVRILLFVLPMLIQTVSTIEIISGARECHSIQRAPAGPHGATEAIQNPYLP